MRSRSLWSAVWLFVLAISMGAQDKAAQKAPPAKVAQEKDVVMNAMRDEMARSMQDLKLPDSPKPYFIAYRVDMLDVNVVAASLGSLLPMRPEKADMIGVEVRVGEPTLDNTNFFSLSMASRGPAGLLHGMRTGPLSEDYYAIRRELWRATDSEYKRAVEDYAAKKAVLENRKQSEPVPDFTTEQKASWSEAPPPARQDAALEQLARELSAAFRKYPQLHTSSVEFTVRSAYTRYVNSEGSWFTRDDSSVKLAIKAETQASDGMPLGDSYEIFAKNVNDLPPKADLLAAVERIGGRVQQLRAAKPLERYNGPVLFEDAAAGEVFAKVFAPALVAVREPLSDNAQFEMIFQRLLGQSGSLMDRVGGRVLPSYFTVVNDPLITELQGAKLPASMHIDDEAVPARRMALVERGILKGLLTTRTPVPTMLKSTGSRRAFGAVPTTLLVSADKASSNAELRKQLLELAKARGNDYAIVVRRVGRGKLSDSFMEMALRMQGRESNGTDSFSQTYKLYADGREELVRGTQVEGLTVANFKEIAAAGDQPVLYSDEFMPKVGASFFSGLSTAAGAGMPVVSYSVPSLLFEELTLKPVQAPFPALPASDPPLAIAAK